MNVVTCVYCGQEYPSGTPTSKAKALTDHIKICTLHPMREAEETISNLTNSICKIFGVYTIHELYEIRNSIKKIKNININHETETLISVIDNTIDSLRRIKHG